MGQVRCEQLKIERLLDITLTPKMYMALEGSGHSGAAISMLYLSRTEVASIPGRESILAEVFPVNFSFLE